MTALDTQILIWGVQGVSHPSQTAMIERTRKFLAQLEKQREPIIVPSPAVYEYLLGFEPSEQVQQRRIIESRFMVPAFDLPAAELAASLQDDAASMKQLAKDHVLRRQQLRVDVMILAASIMAGAQTFVSGDSHFGTFAPTARIRVIEVPEVQTDLFPPGE